MSVAAWDVEPQDDERLRSGERRRSVEVGVQTAVLAADGDLGGADLVIAGGVVDPDGSEADRPGQHKAQQFAESGILPPILSHNALPGHPCPTRSVELRLPESKVGASSGTTLPSGK